MPAPADDARQRHSSTAAHPSCWVRAIWEVSSCWSAPGSPRVRRGHDGGGATRPRPGTLVRRHRGTAGPGQSHRPSCRTRAVHQASLGRARLLLGQRRAGRAGTGVRRCHDGHRGDPRHHSRRARRARALRPERPRPRELAPRPHRSMLGESVLGSRALRAPPRILRLAGRQRCATASAGAASGTSSSRCRGPSLGVYVAFSLWWDAFACLLHPLFFHGHSGPGTFGLVHDVFGPLGDPHQRFAHGLALFVIGIVFLLAAPWVMRGLHQRRPPARTDAPRSGPGHLPGALARAGAGADGRRLRGDAAADRTRPPRRHPGPTRGAGHAPGHGQGEARGARRGRPRTGAPTGRRGAPGGEGGHRRAARHRARHPSSCPRHRARRRAGHARGPQRGADRSSPSTCARRPIPAIEAIAYFCVAELLANVAQHAQASRASVSLRPAGFVAAGRRPRRRRGRGARRRPSDQRRAGWPA